MLPHPDPILVWRFQDAPAHYRQLNDHGGDEDWLAFVPEYLADEYIPWLESTVFGGWKRTQHPVEGGTVWIGAHA